MNSDEKWMQHALALARQAEQRGEVPVGAILVYRDEIIGEGWNQPISANDPTAHAEIMALRDAASRLDNYRLPETTMYVTLEPCPMCAGAIVHARVARLIYAIDDPRTGACGSVFNLVQTDQLNHRVDVHNGVLADDCRELIQAFLRNKRNKT